MQIRTALYVVCGAMMTVVVGCGSDESTAETPTTQPTVVEVASPGSAPTFGTQSGMGFSTGDAIHSSGSGSGYMAYNGPDGTGANGTSLAISDTHHLPPPPPGTQDPVLQKP